MGIKDLFDLCCICRLDYEDQHLRKAMGFSNELFYNVWRIAVRLVLPLSIVIAIMAVIGQVL